MLRAVDKWGLGYLESVRRRSASVDGVRHLMFCVADHFEPYRGGAADDIAMNRLKPWCDNYLKAVDGIRDADGMTPRHTFFYPQEEYNEKCLDMLAGLCRDGAGEVEIHLHHRHDTADGLREKLIAFRDVLHGKHGLLGTVSSEQSDHSINSGHVEVRGQRSEDRGPSPKLAHCGGQAEPVHQSLRHGAGWIRRADCIENQATPTTNNEELSTGAKPAYGFVHGNWALCNSRPDGDWCGVNEELSILAETGCYADFTFPSAPSPTQPRMVNAIYRASDIPGKPRSHDRGGIVSSKQLAVSSKQGEESVSSKQLAVSGKAREDRGQSQMNKLMLIQGPLGLNWKQRKYAILPRLENAEIAGHNPPTADRIDLWARQGIHVMGRPEWIFVKTHTHGCVEENAAIFLGQGRKKGGSSPTLASYLPWHAIASGDGGLPLAYLHQYLGAEYNDGEKWCLHYVTAREMYNIVRAAEDGMEGSPGKYRDYEIAPPAVH